MKRIHVILENVLVGIVVSFWNWEKGCADIDFGGSIQWLCCNFNEDCLKCSFAQIAVVIVTFRRNTWQDIDEIID